MIFYTAKTYTKKKAKYKHNVKQGNIFSSICKTNPKKFWKHLKKLRNSKSSTSGPTAEDFSEMNLNEGVSPCDDKSSDFEINIDFFR